MMQTIEHFAPPQSTEREITLSVRGVSKTFAGERKVDAVSDVSLEVERGKFLAIVGRSGSGKSTLLSMIGGISKPTRGEILVDQINHWSLSENAQADFRNRKIGFVFQFASLLPSLRAVDNVALPALIGSGMSNKEAYARATAMLERVGLADRCDSFPSQLSGGERRRVAIARALINSPELLLADEPTADLDEQTESEILDLLIDIHRRLNITLVVVTHNPDIAARADQLIEMRSGRIVSAETRAPQPVLPSISKDIFAVSAESTKSASVRLGQGIERLLGKMVLLAVPAVATVAALNYGVESYEQGVLAEKAAQRMALEEMALSDLRADVKSITFGPDNTYTVNLYLRNAKGDSPIYVMSPSVRAFVQVGTSWQEVPIEPKGKSVPQVSKIIDENICSFSIKPDITDFAQLIPYYMHVRLTNDMLVSPSDKPKSELIERSDSYYVYLKPHNANDSAILSKLKFPGEPPVWIPMPPH